MHAALQFVLNEPTQVINVFKSWTVNAVAVWAAVLARLQEAELTFNLSPKQLRQAFDK